MAIKRKAKTNLKILSATSMVVFSLLTVFTGTFSWFFSYTTAKTNGSDFKVQNVGESVREIEFHLFNDTIVQNGVEYYTFNKQKSGGVVINEGEATQTGTLEMGTYSTNDPHHPVLILLEVKSGASASIGARTNRSYMATSDYELTADNNPLSSVVEFYYFTYAKDDEDATNINNRVITSGGNEYYSLRTSEFVRGTNSNSFVELDEYGNYHGNFRSSVSLYHGPTESYSHIGIVVDYYSASLEYIYSYFLGHQLLNNDISFSCDWEMVL